jgi:hypothetical protein
VDEYGRRPLSTWRALLLGLQLEGAARCAGGHSVYPDNGESPGRANSHGPPLIKCQVFKRLPAGSGFELVGPADKAPASSGYHPQAGSAFPARGSSRTGMAVISTHR